MSKNVQNRAAALKLAGLASLLLAGTTAGARTATALVQCQPATFGGVPVCAVDMGDYAQVGGGGPVQCPPSVTSTGRTLLCEESFAAAVADAALFFKSPSQPASTYLISIPGGSFDLSSETAPLAGLHGAIDVTGIVPSGDGCLAAGAATSGVVTLSGNPCLIISGAGAGATSLTTATGNAAFFGKNVSHVMFENMTMLQPNFSTTQGVFVAQGTQSIKGVAYPTLTVDISPGFPTPLALYAINCAGNGALGCSKAGLRTIAGGLYMRAFTNSAAPQLIMSTAMPDSNSQVPFGYPGPDGHAQTAVPPTQPERAEFPNRWTITLSNSASGRGVPSYYSATTDGKPNLICMKTDAAQAFWFDDTGSGGSDIIINNMEWIGAARGSFRGVSGGLTGGGLGAQVYNSTIERGPPVQGQAQCLSTQSGGLQFGQPTDPPVYGNLVYGLKSQGTGDDSIAMFNDIGGTRKPGGGYYPQTLILQSAIGNSFARDILLMNSRHYSGIGGNSPVSVDAFTRGQIGGEGNCDPLVLGNDNCPVTYLNN